MSEVFVATTPVETAIREGNYAKTVELLQPLSVQERQRHRASVSRIVKLMWESRWKGAGDKGLLWGYRAEPEQCRAAAAAALLCGTADDAAAAELEARDLLELARTYELPCLPKLAEALMERAPHRVLLVQELIVAGVVQRPDTEAYAIGLIALPRFLRREKSLADCFAEDPGLVEAVLRLFEVQGTADNCLASADKYNVATNSWMEQMIALSRDGRLPRSTLIDKTIGVLEQDWPQYRAGWFSRLHAALDVHTDEMAPHAVRYLHLCQSRIPPTVSLALDALGKLEKDGKIDAAELIRGLRPVFATGTKGQVEAALKLVQRCLKRMPDLGAEAALMLCSALVQEVPALQAKLIKQIAAHAKDRRVRDELMRFVDTVAPSNRSALLDLLGDLGGAEQATPAPLVEAITAEPVALDAEARRLTPVQNPDDLVELVAHVFENGQDIDAFERAVSALVQTCPLDPEDLPRFGPVLKRVAKLKKPVAIELGRLLRFVCQGEREGAAQRLPDYSAPSRIHKLLQARVNDLIDLAAQGKRLPPLSTPTHERGVIALSELINRLRQHVEIGVGSSMAEQALAISRLAPPGSDADLAALQRLPDQAMMRALRHALGDDVAIGSERPLFCAAARIRSPRGDDVSTLVKYGDLGPDGPKAAQYTWEVIARRSGEDDQYVFRTLRVEPEIERHGQTDILAIQRHAHPPGKDPWALVSRNSVAGEDHGIIKYSATLLPSDLEAFFAEGAREIGNNLNWDEARWHHKAYLELLLDLTVQPGSMALLVLACGLGGKEPGQVALAVDALVQMHARGQLDVALFGETLGRLIAGALVKAARLRKSLDAALLVDPALADAIVDVLLLVLKTNADYLPRDHSKLIELMHELLLSTGRRLDVPTVEFLSGLKVVGAAKTTLKKLCALGA